MLRKGEMTNVEGPSSLKPSQTVSPLRIPIFRMVWITTVASTFGGLIQSVGASWMMTSLTHDPTLVALVQASTSLPIMLLSLIAGAAADNFSHRKLILCAQSFMLVVSATLAGLAWQGMLTPWILLGATFLIGVGTAMNAPAWQSSIGTMVPRESLPAAVALNAMGFNLARCVGPAIGGMIVATAGAAAAFMVNACSYLGLIAVMSRWRPGVPTSNLPRERISVAIQAGVRYVWMSPNIRLVLLRATAFGFAASAVPALMPLIARDQVQGGAMTYGILLGSFGMGAVAGALGTNRLRARLSTEGLVSLGSVSVAAGSIGAGISHSLPLTMFALALTGIGWVGVLSTFNVTVQMASPRWVVGRSISLYHMTTFGGMALGSWLSGELADWHSVGEALIIAGLVQAALLLLIIPFRLPQIESLNLDPLRQWSEPDIAVEITPRSGPIVVTIEYRINPDDIPSLLAVMAERRRIRIRDGARNWTLMRDLGDAELWIERFHVATWADYLRHSQRPTKADAANFEQLLELHIGPERPKAHRMIERQTGGWRGQITHEISDQLIDPTRSS